tara:strand:- start:38 stop:8656 length:8619 start_codon:yes stop_codon:yes gene_type:complete
MADDYINDMFNLTGLESEGVTLDQFSEKASSGDEAFLNDMFNLTGLESEGVNLDQFSSGFKKKEQEEQVQEDTESVSEDGSLESQEVTEEVDTNQEAISLDIEAGDYEGVDVSMTDEEMGIVEPVELEVVSEEDAQSEERDVSDEDLVKIDKKQQKVADVSVDDYILNNPESDLFSNKFQEEISDFYENKGKAVSGTKVDQSIAALREVKHQEDADKYLKEKRNSIISESKELGESDAEVSADLKLYNEAKDYGISKLGLSDDEFEDFNEAIEGRSDTLRQMNELKKSMSSMKTKEEKAQAIQEYNKLKELSNSYNKQISYLKENTDRSFTDEDGNVNVELKEKVDAKVSEFKTEYKSDYKKILERLIKEKARLDSYNSSLSKSLSPEEYQSLGGQPRLINEGTDQEQILGTQSTLDHVFGDVGSGYVAYFNPALEGKAEIYEQAYRDTEENIAALSRLAFLNEDPAAVSKGDDYGITQFFSSAAESLYEARTGKDYVSDKDYRQKIIPILKQEGIKLTEEQLDSETKQFSEELGEVAGVSADIGIDIALTKGFMGAVGKATRLAEAPAYLARIKYVRNSPKLIKFLDGTMEAITEGIAFELASDETSFIMGLAEGGTASAFKGLGKALKKGKYGAFFNYIDTYATRIASQTTARTIGGTVEEYTGDWMDQGVKNGFFTEEQYKNTFGEGEEGFKKFLLTAALSGGMGLPVSFISAMKKEASDSPGGEIAQAVEAYEAAMEESSKPEAEATPEEVEAINETKEVLEVDELEEIEKRLTPEEETEEEVVTEEEEKPKTKDPEDKEEEVVAEPTTEPDTISEEEIEESQEIENIPEEERTPEQKKIASKRQVTESQKKVSKISKALKKIVPGVNFVLHNTEESYNNSSESDVSDSRGYRDGKNIHINVSESLDNTTFHEAIHPVLDAVFEKSPEVYSKLVKSMKSDPDFKDYMDNATADYTGENTQVNEALTEMMSDVASGKFNEGSTVYEKVKDFVKEVLTKLNLRASDFNIDLSKEVDVRQFAETIGKALAKGKEITLEKEGKLAQQKFYERVNKTKEVTKEGLAKAKEKANVVVSKSLSTLKTGLSDSSKALYESITKTKDITVEGLIKATSSSKEFKNAVSSILSKVSETSKEALDYLVAKAKDTVVKGKEVLEITKDNVKEKSEQLKLDLDNIVKTSKDSFSKKSKQAYKTATGLSKVTSEGIVKAAITSKEFLESLAPKVKAIVEKVILTLEAIVLASGISVSTLVAGDFVANDFETEITAYEVLSNTPNFVFSAIEGTYWGNKIDGANTRLYNKYGNNSQGAGSEDVSFSDIKGETSVKESKEVKGQDPALTKYISDNTTFTKGKPVPLKGRSGDSWKVIGETRNITNQFPADSGFIYIAAPNQGSNTGKRFKAKGEQVAQFLLDASISNDQTYQKDNVSKVKGQYLHKNTTKTLEVDKKRDGFVPIYEKLEGDLVNVKYKRFSELSKEDKIMSPLRQFKFSDINWEGKEHLEGKGFGEGVYGITLKKGKKYPYPGKEGSNSIDIVFSTSKDAYGMFDGIGAVFIFKDSKNVTFVREFNGSINQIKAMGESITQEYGTNPEDITIGYHDVGSFSARPSAENGVVDSEVYENFNTEGESGAALYYPPTEVNFQKKGKTELQNKADTLADKSKKEYDKQKNSGKNTEEAAKETFRKVFKNASWFNKLSKVDQASVEADFNNRLVETFENPNPAKNQKGKPPKPKDTSDKVVTTVMKQLKEKWKNQDKGITEGKREAVKSVKEAQAEFQKDLNDVTKYLSESKRKRAELLLRKVKDQKSLEESRAALDALVSDKQVYVTAKESDINAELIRAEKKAEKNLTIEQRKRLKEITKDLKGRLKGKVNLRTAIQIANKLAGLDPFDISKVAEFESFVNNVVEDTEYTTKKSTAKSLQTKIKNKLKSLNKQAGKSKLGIRQVKATELAKLDINRIEDLEAFNEIAEKVLESLSGKQVSFAEVSSQLDVLVSETQKATKEFNEKLAKEQEAKIRAEYEASPMRDTMSFEKYQEIVEDIRQDELTAKAEAKLEESSDEMRSWISNRIDVIKSNLDVITSGMTPAQKAIIKTLIKAKDIISNKSIVGVKSLAKINQALDEIITYNSTSGVGIIDAELEALRASVNLARTLKGKLDPSNFLAKKGKGIMSIISQKSNLTQFFKGITKGGEAMRNAAQKTVAKFNSGFRTAKALHNDFNNKLTDLADVLKIKEDQSIRIGIISRLEQNTQGLTEEESNLDLEEKITAIKNEIKTLKLSEYKSDKRMGAKLEKAFNSLKLEGIKTKKELKSKLTDNENKFLDFAKLEFSEIRESYQETYRNSYGKELELEDNYLPTFARKKGENQKDIESSNYARTMDSDAQGRSIKRAKTDMTGATVYNYDIKRTASEGYYQTQYDINTLRDRQVLNSLMNSPVFKDLLMGRNAENVNGSHIELYEEFVNRMKTLAGKRKSSTSLTEAEKSKFKKISSKLGNSLVVLPLKDVTQFIKQPAAIIVNTMLRHPATFIQAFGDVSQLIISNIQGLESASETSKAVRSLLNEGNTPMRDTMGDLDIKKYQSWIEDLTDLTPKGMKRVLNALGSGALGEADMIATQGNWMANYRSFRRKQEGKGFKFDAIEEAKNPNAEAVNAANIASDEVNNVSDTTTKNEDKTGAFTSLFFLFKSFSINQTIHTYLDIKNAVKSGSKSDKIEASKALAGSLLSVMAFAAVKEYVINNGIDQIMNELFGELDKDEDDEKGVMSFLAEGLAEMFMGGSPDDLMDGAKLITNAVSDVLGEEEVFKIYDNLSGVSGLTYSYLKDFAKDMDVLFGSKDYKEDGRTYEMDYTSDMKTGAMFDLLGLILQWGNMKRIGEKTKKSVKKREK